MVHCTTVSDSPTILLHASPPMSTVGGTPVASIIPMPAITNGTPDVAIEVGVMDVTTGRVASATQVVQVTGRVAGLTHVTDTLTAACGLPLRSVPTAGWLVFQPTHSAASERDGMQPIAVHGTPATDAAVSCGTPPPPVPHRPTPVSVMFMIAFAADAGGSSCSSALAPSAGVVSSSDGSTPVTLNAPPASCTTAATLTASEAGAVHDSVVDDSQTASVHGTPPNHTTSLSMTACAGGCSPTSFQSAAASRGAGSRSTTRPLPVVCGVSPRPPPGVRATAGGGVTVTFAPSRCGMPPMPACTTHTAVSTGAVAAAGNKNGRAHNAEFIDTAVTGPHDTLAAAGCSPAGTR